MVENVLRRDPERPPAPASRARLLAAMLVGMAHQATAEARRAGTEPAEAARLATAVALAAMRGLPRDALR
jgi:hypothetical protein